MGKGRQMFDNDNDWLPLFWNQADCSARLELRVGTKDEDLGRLPR